MRVLTVWVTGAAELLQRAGSNLIKRRMEGGEN
jgi:hypothetical protein